MPPLNALFTEHPRAVNESYWQHAKVALGFSCRLALAALAALVHAVLPCLFERTASNMIEKLHVSLSERH